MKKNFLFAFVFCMACCFNSPAQTTMPGFQVGYQYSKVSRAELGINWYTCWEDLFDHYHVLGPYASLTGASFNKTFYVGQQYGINYHFMPMEDHFFAYRICMAYENNRLNDQRIGADLGTSFFGLFAYVGYYHPIGVYENKSISRFRVGFRIVLNGAPVEEIVDF